jgi:hypothetical protein
MNDTEIAKIFKNMADARPGGDRSPYMQVGSYDVHIVDIFLKESENPKRRDAKYLITKFRIVNSSNPTFVPGQECSWSADVTWPSFEADTKSLMLAILNEPLTPESNELACQLILAAVGHEGAKEWLTKNWLSVGEMVKDKVVHLDCKMSRNGQFTKHYWSAKK